MAKAAAMNRVVLGRPISSGELGHTLLPKAIALPVFSSDPLSSNPCRVAGIVQSLRLDPRNGVIEVTLADGTGAVLASWMIRRPTPQLSLVPGCAVVLSGVTSIGPDGDIVLVEPDFAVVPAGGDVAA